MAKTFKNLPRPSESTAPKPTSERDFFDLSDVPASVEKAVEKPETARNIGNTSNISNTGNIGNTAKTTNAISAPAAVPAAASAAPDGVRQTFVLSRGHLEQLRAAHPGLVLDTVIRESIALGEAPHLGQDIFAYAPQSAGAADYQALVAEILTR